MSKRRVPKKRSRQDAIYRVALAGISAALAILFVWLGVVVRYSTVAFFIAAGIALMVPLTKKYYTASVFAYIVSSALSFLIAGDIFTVVGYIAYFGPMSILTGIFCNKKVKIYISIPVKILYINGALALLYFVCNTIVIDISAIGEIPYWAIALVGTIALLLLDLVIQFIYARLIPVIGKALRRNSKTENANAQTKGSDSENDLDGGDDMTVFEDNESPFCENMFFKKSDTETSNYQDGSKPEKDDDSSLTEVKLEADGKDPDIAESQKPDTDAENVPETDRHIKE